MFRDGAVSSQSSRLPPSVIMRFVVLKECLGAGVGEKKKKKNALKGGTSAEVDVVIIGW